MTVCEENAHLVASFACIDECEYGDDHTGQNQQRRHRIPDEALRHLEAVGVHGHAAVESVGEEEDAVRHFATDAAELAEQGASLVLGGGQRR